MLYSYTSIIKSMKQVQMQRPLIYKQLYLETPKPNESRPQNGERDKKELFLTLYDVYLKALILKEFCIFICGDTRTGKSTLHNCLVNPKVLVGKEEGLNNYYVSKDPNNPQVAKIGSSLTSVTMMPNISLLNAQTTIVDLPGMGERGKGVEVIKVNYINAKFFSAPKKAKFIVVFTQGALKDIDNGGFKDTLHNFLSFFNAQHFSSVEEKRQLFSSIAFCFTSVDFKKKSYEKVKQKYLSELLVMLDKLEKWYQVKPSQMPSFPLAKELVKTIVAQKRIQLFELAVEGQSPAYNKFLQSFDKNNWRYLNIREKIDKIVYPYDKQYQALDQTQRKLVDDIIEWRFSLCQKMRTNIGQMLAKVINNFGQKIVNIDEQLKTLQDFLKFLPNYGNPKQQFEAPQVCTIDQRLHCFQKLDEAASKMKNLDIWKKTNNLSPESDYYTRHLTRMFEEQIILIKRLFSYSSAALDMLKRLQDNIYKMLTQAAIFSHLSHYYKSKFMYKFAEQISFGSQIGNIGIGTVEQIKQKFIEYFQNNSLQIQDYRTEDVKRIIKLFGQIKGEFKDMNPTIFYGISFKLKHMLAHIYRSNKMTTQFVEQSYSALIEAVKSHICFALIPLSSSENELQQLVGLQRSILRQTDQIFNPEKNRNRINGNMQLKLAFEGLVRSKDRDEFKSIVKSIFVILADLMRAQFKNLNLTKEQMLPTITVSSNANNEAEIHTILSQYHTVMKSQINEEKVRIETPITYSLSNQAQIYDKIKEKIKDKKIIFVFGEQLGGKSVIIEVLKRKKMSFNKDGRFDLTKQSRTSKINHTNFPSQYPNVTSLDDNELFVEIPFYHDLQPQEKYIKMSLLLDLMKSISKFRILWVVKEATLKGKLFESSISQVIKLLVDSTKKAKQVKESVITLVVNYLISDKAVCRKHLEAQIESLNTVDKKVAKYLSSILFTNQLICEGMNKCEFIANDFQNLKASYFDSSKLAITYEGLCTKLTPDKEFLIRHILDKINLVRSALTPLQGLASDSLSEFVEGTKLSEKNWFYNNITRCLEEPIVKGYEVDLSNLPKYETTVGLIDNRPFIYYKAIELRKAAQILDAAYDFNVTYQKYGNYMEYFFNNMVYLCCINKEQYTNFMKIRMVLAILLKELEYYSLIFKDGGLEDYRFEQLNGQLRFRDITDRMTNFTYMNGYDLMKRLMGQAGRWKDNELRSYIELLCFFIKSKTTITPTSVAAMIELLIFTLRLRPNKNFAINWDKELTEKRLIESIFNYSFIQKNSSKNLLAFGKFQQQASEKTLNELASLKMKLIA